MSTAEGNKRIRYASVSADSASLNNVVIGDYKNIPQHGALRIQAASQKLEIYDSVSSTWKLFASMNDIPASAWSLSGNSLAGSEVIGSSNNHDVKLVRNNASLVELQSGKVVVKSGNNLELESGVLTLPGGSFSSIPLKISTLGFYKGGSGELCLNQSGSDIVALSAAQSYFTSDILTSSGGFFQDYAQNKGFYNNGNNSRYFNNVGDIELSVANNHGVHNFVRGSGKFKVCSGSGAYEALKVFTSGADSADNTSLEYAGIVKPVNGGRLVTPNALPSAPQVGEVYVDSSAKSLNVRVDSSTWLSLAKQTPSYFAYIPAVKFSNSSSSSSMGTQYYSPTAATQSNITPLLYSTGAPGSSSNFIVSFPSIIGSSITSALLTVQSGRAGGTLSQVTYNVGEVSNVGTGSPIYFQVLPFFSGATGTCANFNGTDHDLALTLLVQ